MSGLSLGKSRIVERVAVALNDEWAANPSHGAFWDDLEPQEQERWREAARVAIETITRVASFDDLTEVARLILDKHYPADIFVGGGPNTDPGVQLVVALRACDEARVAAAPTDTTEENTDGNC